jgi:hypothetical protein
MPIGDGADDAPIFVQAGIDAIVPGAAGLDTVYRLAIARGQCDAFAGSSNGGIADNYGVDCSSAKTPASAQSAHQLVGRADYALGRGGRISFLALGSAAEQRAFRYEGLYSPDHRYGGRRSGSVFALMMSHPLGAATAIDARVSRQRDRILDGPVTNDPFDAGTIPGLGSLDFVYDFERWPVNDELVTNYRVNTGVRAPCIAPLADPSECQTTDRIRNNAYGVQGFEESGGPAGMLRLYQEDRTVLQAAVSHDVGRVQRIRVGAEHVLTTAAQYTHQTNAQAGSDVWREEPVRSAVFMEDEVALGAVSLAVGLRLDRFDSRARRPYYSCTAEQDAEDGSTDGSCGGSMAVGERHPFPRLSTSPLVVGAPDQAAAIDAILVADEAHTTLSPRVSLVYVPSERTVFRAGFARLAQIPEYGMLFAGVNTDLAITNFRAAWGSDVGFQTSRIIEGGVTHRLGSSTTVGGGVFHRWLDAVPVLRLVRRFDPFRRGDVDVREWQHDEADPVKGATLVAGQSFGAVVSARAAYTVQDADLAHLRPHTLAAQLAVRLPGATSGADGPEDGLIATFRWASGTQYQSCDDPAALSDELCVTGLGDMARLPSVKTLDLRVAKAFAVGGRALTVYADARNVLGTQNVLRVFRSSGNPWSSIDHDLAAASDSTQFASQAAANGVYDPATAAMDLRFGGAGEAGCGGFVDASGGGPAAADCVYLIRAEQRFGDGDGVFTYAEQAAASEAYYRTYRGIQEMSGDPRHVRFGLQIGF